MSGMVSVMDPCHTQNGVHLLRIVLPLKKFTRLLEMELDRSTQDIRDFYIYFDAYTQLLSYDLLHLHGSISFPESEPFATLILTRLDEVVSEDIGRNFPKPIVSDPIHVYFKHVEIRYFLSQVLLTIFL